METLTDGQPFGRYRLLALIGRGGMGEVYLATGPGLEGAEKRLAIKRLLPALAEDPGFVARFLDEARIMVQLSHGNIVPVFEAGRERGEYFLAMEFVDGRNLRELARALAASARSIPVPLAVLVAHEVVRGLDHAHRKCDAEGRSLGIIHRDVSPQNVLVGFDGEVRLLDFGIAKAAGRTQRTATGGLLGKFGYMSPEQAMGLPLDGRSDLFALGAVLHELLTGEPLFDGESDPEILRKVQEAQVPAPSVRRPEVPPELDGLVLRMLARDPGQRFASAGELEQALGALRYRLGAGPEALAALMRGLFEKRLLGALELPGPDALPLPRPATATFQQPATPAPAPVLRSRARTAALVLSLPAAAALGYLVPRRNSVAARPVAPQARGVQPEPQVPHVETGAAGAASPSPVVVPAPASVARAPQPAVEAISNPAHASRREPGRHHPAEPREKVSAPVLAEPPRRLTASGAASAPRPGTLSLRVIPWGDIEIDGVKVGETSLLVRHPVSAGIHHLRVFNPALNTEKKFNLLVSPGADLVQKVDLGAK